MKMNPILLFCFLIFRIQSSYAFITKFAFSKKLGPKLSDQIDFDQEDRVILKSYLKNKYQG
jgi:hypothetical protein